MRTIIAGSRSITDMAHVINAIDKSGFKITTVISGGARGVDQLGAQWAKSSGVSCETYPADWSKYGRSAGMIRNQEMSRNADALIAVWDGVSHGTAHMIRIARKRGLSVYVLMLAPSSLQTDDFLG